MGTTKDRRYDGIQVLRGIAALLVVWTHIKHSGDFTSISWAQNYSGASGVDIFFVISGFVICISAKNLDFNPCKFLLNRITRVAPLYWITSIPIIFIFTLKGHPLNWKTIANSFIFIPVFDINNLTVPINAGGWSLSFEFWFYLLFAFMLWATRAQAWKATIIFLTAGAIIVYKYYESDYYLPKFLFNPLVFEFVAGALIYRISSKLGWGVAVLAFISILLMTPEIYKSGMQENQFGDYTGDFTAAAARAMLWGTLGALLVLLVVALDNKGAVAWPNWMLRLGDYSYSIYIIQPYTLWLAAFVKNKWGLSAWSSGSVFVLSTILLGGALSLLIEKRLTLFARQIFAPARIKTISTTSPQEI